MKGTILLAATAAILFQSVSPVSADIRGRLDEDGYLCFYSPEDNVIKYDKMISKAATKFKVDSALIIAVIKAESDFDHKAVSKKGAKGLMQIMPDTASLMNIEEPFSPEENIMAGTSYLSLLLERFNYNKKLALAAYNAGPETVEAYHGVPPFAETRNYVRNVLKYYRYYSRFYRISEK